MFRINPGEFKHPIEIFSVKQSQDDDFIPIEEELILLKTRAKILNISGKETLLSDKTISSNIKRFYIRYKNIELTTDCKLKYNNKTYNITYISDIEEKHKYFEIVGELLE